MRTFIMAAASLVAFSVPAFANRCYWIHGIPHCDPGCFLRARWYDSYGRQWIEWWCIPEELIIAGIALAVLVVVGVVAAIASAANKPAPYATEIALAETQAAEAERITQRMKAAAAEADKFLETYRR